MEARIQELRKELESLIIKVVQSVGDNPTTVRLGGSAFAIRFRDLGASMRLSPNYHSWDIQKSILFSYLRTKPVLDWVKEIVQLSERCTNGGVVVRVNSSKEGWSNKDCREMLSEGFLQSVVMALKIAGYAV